MCFTLIDEVPIDMHYTTDTLQRVELKIIIYVLLKKQSHLYLMPWGQAGKHHFHFWMNYPFKSFFYFYFFTNNASNNY